MQMQMSVSPPGAKVRVDPMMIARALLSEMPEARRLALAAEIVRDAQDPSCRLQLRCLARSATETVLELDKRALAEAGR